MSNATVINVPLYQLLALLESGGKALTLLMTSFLK